ncbi:hypothetical protein A5816_000557 [Enterococcus sp. 3G1_DIV0629]|uniref:DUF1642 domain-containing protein n=1 Tax=Enterococcus sp. (strain 3G1_DIV0629) TaxID=1834176 RepID=UPI000A346475|nr:DUF1642 domain-containing protein [Enterococcus sp. 3G1_DIV0629]OTO28291.1 hypothetical protein A5816_000557 [Enterococcus sp. 3G1_DIV0629]
MNKQEAIKKLESIKTIGNDARAACYNEGINAGITIIKQLDEPQKPVIQQFVADLVDWTNKMQCSPSDVIRDLHDNGDLANLPRDLELDKLSEYFEKAYCRYDFEKACFVGYEVEKEPMYRVKLGEGYFVEYQGRGALIIPDGNKEIKMFDSKSDAERTAQTIGGTVEEVVEG